MYCQTLPRILKSQEAPRLIDWLSLDVEGAELEILTPLLEGDHGFAAWTGLDPKTLVVCFFFFFCGFPARASPLEGKKVWMCRALLH